MITELGCCKTLFASHDVDAAGDQLSGLSLTQAANGTVTFEVLGGTVDSPATGTWATDPTCSAQLATAGPHYFAMVLDVGPGSEPTSSLPLRVRSTSFLTHSL